jgi:cytoskeletal protein CcmA (bactofilin family)
MKVGTMADEATEQTCIGKGTELEGTLKVSGNLRIDGKVKGQVEAEGQLVVGAGAQVTANVTASILKVEGEVNGDLKASQQISLAPSARVTGSLESPALSIERGALFEGTCKMHGNRQNVLPLVAAPPAQRAARS